MKDAWSEWRSCLSSIGFFVAVWGALFTLLYPAS